jgi:hypothetical protein
MDGLSLSSMLKLGPQGVRKQDISAWLEDLHNDLPAYAHFISWETKPTGPFLHGFSLCATRQQADGAATNYEIRL